MKDAGSALMGIGSARGDDRSQVAAEMAIASPLLESSMEGARGVLINISGGSDLGLFEITNAADIVREAASPEANIIFGTVIDDALGDEVRITVIAAGFEGGAPRPRTAAPSRRTAVPAPVIVDVPEPEPEPVGVGSYAADTPTRTVTFDDYAEEPRRGGLRPEPRRPVVFEDDDDLDVPDFLK